MNSALLSSPLGTVVKDLRKLTRFLWAAALLTLPVTSFRWFPFLGETTYVRPLSLYPMVFLIPLLLIQWWRGQKLNWSGAIVPLGMLTLFIIVATCVGIFINPVPMRGQEYSGRVLRALVTLFIGLSFFITAMWMNKDEDDLRFSVQWILAGLCLDLAWSGLQAITFYTHIFKKEMVTHWQLAFSMRELVRSNRISGLAYEPAWLAGQFATIFFPWLFASILTNYHLTKFKWLEAGLLLISLPFLLATYSRGGLLTVIIAGGLTVLFLGRDVLRTAWNWFFSGFRANALEKSIRVGLILVVVIGIAGAGVFLSSKGYVKRLWQINADSFSQYLVDINVGARSAYSSGAYAAFEDHPWSGVGFGASGFYIYQNLPDWTLTTVTEIAKQLSPDNNLYPNPKNLYVRLLAETGLLGFILFLAFQFYILGDMLSLLRRQPWARFAATAGVFAWIAITFYNFTQDSVATPNIWLIPGILAGLSATSLIKENS